MWWEKTGTKQGGSHPAPDEDWQHGYPHEFQDFGGSDCQRPSTPLVRELARDTIGVLYSAYLSAERRGLEVEVTPVEDFRMYAGIRPAPSSFQHRSALGGGSSLLMAFAGHRDGERHLEPKQDALSCPGRWPISVNLTRSRGERVDRDRRFHQPARAG